MINTILAILITIGIPVLITKIEAGRKKAKLQGRDYKGRYAKVKKIHTKKIQVIVQPKITYRKVPVYQLGEPVKYITLQN